MPRLNTGIAPGRYGRQGITLPELSRLFPSEESATEWIEGVVWADGRVCPRCRGSNTYRSPHKTMPYRCRPCKRYFSVKTGTVLAASNMSLLTWVWAIYLELTSLKGVSSMKLHRDLGISQKAAWFLLQRIREAFKAGTESGAQFEGPVEVDEAYFGGLEKNKHEWKRLNEGRGAKGKTAVVGIKDRSTGRIRAQVVKDTTGKTLKGFVYDHVEEGAEVFTDEARAYVGLKGVVHKAVKHSVSKFVDGQVHTNGLESFWAGLKRAYHGTYHHISPKHLNRYIAQFAGKHNIRPLDTMDQMESLVRGMVDKRLKYKDLTA